MCWLFVVVRCVLFVVCCSLIDVGCVVCVVRCSFVACLFIVVSYVLIVVLRGLVC